MRHPEVYLKTSLVHYTELHAATVRMSSLREWGEVDAPQMA